MAVRVVACRALLLSVLAGIVSTTHASITFHFRSFPVFGPCSVGVYQNRPDFTNVYALVSDDAVITNLQVHARARVCVCVWLCG